MSLARVALDRADCDVICRWAGQHTGSRKASLNLSFIADLIRAGLLDITEPTNVETANVPSSTDSPNR